MKKIRIKPKLKTFTKVVLSLPAVLSLAWIGLEVRNRGVASGEVLLSPPVDNNMLIAALILFTSGYIFFIMMIFSEDIKDFFFKRPKSSR